MADTQIMFFLDLTDKKLCRKTNDLRTFIACRNLHMRLLYLLMGEMNNGDMETITNMMEATNTEG